MIPQDLQYDFPNAAFLLFGIILIFLLFWILFHYRRKALDRFAQKDLQSELVINRSKTTYWTKVAALCLAWIFATLALMGPKGNGRYPENAKKELEQQQKAALRQKAHNVVFLIDASASMDIADVRGNKTRLNYAKEIADEIASDLTGQNAALQAFTSQTTQLSPLTMDYFFLRMMLRQLKINEGDVPGTDFVQALTKVRDLYFAPPEKRLNTLILISDGGDTALEPLQGPARQSMIRNIQNLIPDPAALNLRIFTIGVGTKDGGNVPKVSYEGSPVHSELQDDLLQQLAEKGRGKYFYANDMSAVDIAHGIFAIMSQDSPFVTDTNAQRDINLSQELLIYTLYFQIPLGLALLFLGYALIYPETRKLKAVTQTATVLLCLFNSSLLADASEVTKANLLFEAKAYLPAQTIYENLLGQNLTPWQKAVVLFNLGSTQLAQKEYEKAIETFLQININQNSSPLLVAKIKNNFALARLNRGKEILKNIILDSPNAEEEYLNAIYMFRDGLLQVAQAEKADCRLQEMEGQSACEKSDDLIELRNVLKQNLANALQDFAKYQINFPSVRDGISEMLYSTSILKDDLQFLKNNTLPDELKLQYKQFFLENLRFWLPLWSAMKGTFKEDEEKKLLQEAEDNYKAALKAFEEEDWAAAENAIRSSEKTLNQLSREVWGSAPLEVLLVNLIKSYDQAVSTDPITITTITRLQNDQTQLAAGLSQQDKALRILLEDPDRYLEVTREYIQQSDRVLARLYLTAAYQQVKILQYSAKDRPETILQDAIDTEHDALTMNRQGLQIENFNDVPSEVILQGQNNTLKIAANFLPAIYDAQMKEFQKGQCQKKPWDDVLPLFNKGYQSAQAAANLIQDQPIDGMKKQEESIKYWQEALKKLKESKNPQKETKPEEQEAEEQQMEQQTVDQSLQLLQEMQIDDQIPQKGVKPLKEVQKPW